MARSFVTLTFVTLTATSLGVFAAVGCGSTGKVSLGADDDHLTTCDPASCGPALGAPTTKCADGSLGGNTGRCVKTSSSSCGWEIRTCTDPTATDCKPPPPVVCADGTVTVAGCSKDSSGVCVCAGTTCPGGGSCTPAACGANPFGAPNYKCADGSTGGPVCDASPGKCGWYIRSCPSSDAGVDGAPIVDASPDASACFDPSGAVPESMRACKTTADCTIGPHQINCCGTILYTGITTSSKSAFDACEKPWDAHFPACGCAMSSGADDGKMISDPTKIAVRCIVPTGATVGTCQTTSCVAGQMCTSGGSCSTGCGGVNCTCSAAGVYECRPNLC